MHLKGVEGTEGTAAALVFLRLFGVEGVDAAAVLFSLPFLAAVAASFLFFFSIFVVPALLSFFFKLSLLFPFSLPFGGEIEPAGTGSIKESGAATSFEPETNQSPSCR